MTQSVTIRTGARLHFGLLANRPVSGREFGGIGLMIAQPGWTVHVEPAAADEIVVEPAAATSNPEASRRTAKFLVHYRRWQSNQNSRGLPLPETATVDVGFRIRIETAIPAHQGLGSGTQLGLAIAKSLAVLSQDDASSEELARRVSRGRRSAIGIWGFDLGGFLVDGGKLPEDDIGVLVARLDVPSDWRFLLVSPIAQVGLSGAEELAAFGSLPPMSQLVTQRLSQLVLTSLLPALRQHRFEEFSASLFEYGRLVGEYFAPAQGGIFASPLMAFLSEQFAPTKFARPVQTSWGPTCAIPCRNDAEANELLAVVRTAMPSHSVELSVVAVAGPAIRLSHKC